VDDEEKYNQPAIEHMDPAEENKNILTGISLPTTRG
jgi:hypothetical protein